MSTAIHHGAPGSFKSFTLVQNFAIEALKQGRLVVTNIRGFTSIDRVEEQFPDYKIPASADIIYIDTEIEYQRLLLACWFHWVPIGCLILIDEAQRIYPKRRDFRLQDLDNKLSNAARPSLNGINVTDISIETIDSFTGIKTITGRPETVHTAFDMQRHFQWDIHLSTPNIEKIQPFIRQVAESAYRHKSLGGKLPLFYKNTWYEFQHDAENNGKLASHISGKPRKYKADERVFKCYQSTATGEHTASNADQSVLGDPKIKLLLLVIILCFGTFIYLFATHKTIDKTVKTVQPVSIPQITNDSIVYPAKNNTPVNNNGFDNVSNIKNNYIVNKLGFDVLSISYQDFADKTNKRMRFFRDSAAGLKFVDVIDLLSVGIKVSAIQLCRVRLIFPDKTMRDVLCNSPAIDKCAVVVKTHRLYTARDCHKYVAPVSVDSQIAKID